jgi:hypothetical protein
METPFGLAVDKNTSQDNVPVWAMTTCGGLEVERCTHS